MLILSRIEFIEALIQVGFNENDAKVYFALFQLGHAKVLDLAEEAEIECEAVCDSLGRLEKQGLVIRDTIYLTPQYRAFSPKSVFTLMQNDFSQKIELLNKLGDQLSTYKSPPPAYELNIFKFEIKQIEHYAAEIIHNSKGEVKIVFPNFELEAFSTIANNLLGSFIHQNVQFILVLPQTYLKKQKLKIELLENCAVFLWAQGNEIPFGLISNEASQALQVFPTDCIFIQNSAIIPYFNTYVGLLQKFTSRISFESIERMAQM